jgi:hypothetical protein
MSRRALVPGSVALEQDGAERFFRRSKLKKPSRRNNLLLIPIGDLRPLSLVGPLR